MKYEPGDVILFGNAGYERECTVVTATPPQPTYLIQPLDGSSAKHRIEENQLELVRKKPAPCGHIRGRIEKRVPLGDKWHEPIDWYIPNDFCPLCGEDLR